VAACGGFANENFKPSTLRVDHYTNIKPEPNGALLLSCGGFNPVGFMLNSEYRLVTAVDTGAAYSGRPRNDLRQVARAPPQARWPRTRGRLGARLCR
jgi:hypothetical protein